MLDRPAGEGPDWSKAVIADGTTFATRSKGGTNRIPEEAEAVDSTSISPPGSSSELYSTAVIESNPSEIVCFQERLLKMLEQHRFGSEDRFAIRLAVHEALANAANHGNKRSSAKKIRIALSLTAKGFRIRIRDEGTGFDPGGVPDSTLDENLRKSTGRGLLLMRSYMHAVRFSRRGNAVSMARCRTVGA